MGRTLDPLDAKTGYPVEVVGGQVREVQGPVPLSRALDKPALAAARAKAIALAKEQAQARAGGDVVDDSKLSIGGVASAAPYIVAALVVLVVIVKMRKV